MPVITILDNELFVVQKVYKPGEYSTEWVFPKAGVTRSYVGPMTKADAEREAYFKAQREEKNAEDKIEGRAIATLSEREQRIHTLLDAMIRDCEEAGLNEASFPHAARMILIDYARKIAAET